LGVEHANEGFEVRVDGLVVVEKGSVAQQSDSLEKGEEMKLARNQIAMDLHLTSRGFLASLADPHLLLRRFLASLADSHYLLGELLALLANLHLMM